MRNAANRMSKCMHAGNLVREVAKLAELAGGGRADFAHAGAKDVSKLAEALAAVPGLLRSTLPRSRRGQPELELLTLVN